MSIKGLNPYLHFNGTARDAIALYESALGAKTETLSPFAEAPGMNAADERKDWVMHSELRIGSAVLMVSDTMTGDAVVAGSNVQICLHFDDVAAMTTKFEALSAGGAVTTPLQDTFWGATFGTLTDAFGIRWMFNCTKQG
jgi:PhnB protein